MLRSDKLRQIRNKRNLFSIDQQPKSQVIRMSPQTKFTVFNEGQINQQISSPENIRESMKSCNFQTVACENRDFDKKVQHQISEIEKQYQRAIIENLLKKFELDSLSICELMKQVSQFVQFTQFIPKAKSIEGINILSNGIFHKLWARLLLQQNPAHFESLRKQYYNCYNHTILENYQDFYDIFGNQTNSHHKNIEQQATYIQQFSENPQYEHNCQVQPNAQNENFLMSENQQAEALLFTGFGHQKQLVGNPFDDLHQQQKDYVEKLSPKIVHHDEQDVFISLNYKLLKDRQNNERRRSAEMVCLFFGISFSTTFSSKEIEVTEVLQLYRQAKFQFSVFLAKKKTSRPNYLAKNQFLYTNQAEENRIYITCYKLMNLQQLIRLELTYGKIYGFITYSQTFDFLMHLQEIKNNMVKKAKLEKLNEYHKGTRRSNIKKYSVI